MSRLLDFPTARKLLQGRRHVVAHAAAHVGQVSLCATTVFDFRVWILNPKTLPRFAVLAAPFLQRFQIRDLTQHIATEAAYLTRHFPAAKRSRMLVPAMLAATALAYNLILVTHDPTPYAQVPGLTLEDWAVP